MNWLDIVIAIPLLLGAWQGYKKGLVYMVAMIIGLVLGLYLAFKLDGWVSGLIRDHWHSHSNWIPFVSFFIILTSVILILIILAKLLEQILKLSSLTPLNKAAGVLLGIFQYAFVLSIVLYLISNFEPSITMLSPQNKNESFLYKYVAGFGPMINPALKSIQTEFEENIGKVDSLIPDKRN